MGLSARHLGSKWGVRPVLAHRNIMQAIYLIVHFLETSFFKKKVKLSMKLVFQRVIDIKHD